MQSKSRGNEQKHLFIKKYGQFWLNQAAFRPKLICAPAACALRAIAREKIIITRQTDHHHKIWQKCHPICENEIVSMFERKVIWGCPKMSRNRIAGLNKSNPEIGHKTGSSISAVKLCGRKLH